MSDDDAILEFPTDEMQFALGFEAGRIWELLKLFDFGVLRDQPIHAANAEVIMRMLDALDLIGVITTEFSDDEHWLFLRTP